MTRWKRVSFAADCQDDACAVCGRDYADCPCPGPTMDGWEYRITDGVLEAQKTMRPGRSINLKPRQDADRKLCK